MAEVENHRESQGTATDVTRVPSNSVAWMLLGIPLVIAVLSFFMARWLGWTLGWLYVGNFAATHAFGMLCVPYAFVRHPMYVGLIGLMLATPVMLDSRWTFIPVIWCIVIFVIRTALEDRTLHAELPGYPEYSARVQLPLGSRIVVVAELPFVPDSTLRLDNLQR